MAQKRILAVALGNPSKSKPIKAIDPTRVRKYINGLISYLAEPDVGTKPYIIGKDYYIDYYECYEDDVDFKEMASPNPDVPTVLFCMSTPVVREAEKFSDTISIVGIFSDRTAEKFDKTKNICGVNAKRIDHGWDYYDKFVTNFPGLQYVYILNKKNNAASKGALSNIENHSPPPSKPIVKLDVTSAPGHDIVSLVKTVPSGSGLLVLPVDMFFGYADDINQSAAKGVPVFWPAKEFTDPPNDSTLYYGASQFACGKAMGKQVQYVFDNNCIPGGSDRFVIVDPD